MEQRIAVHAVGLSELAGRCEVHAARLGSVTPPSVAGAGFQPSAAAVIGAHAEVAAAGARLVARMQSTASTLVSAASGYVGTDADNAAEVAAVGAQGVAVV